MEVGIFTPRTESKARNHCSVHGCRSAMNKNLDLIFHAFPKKGKRWVYIKNIFGGVDRIDQFKAWKNVLRIDGTVTNSVRVCSLHFRRDDYILPDVASHKRRLKSTSVPSCNLPQSSVDTSRKNERMKIAREERYLKRTSQHAEEKIDGINSKEEETILIDVLEDMDHESTNHLCEDAETIAQPVVPQVNPSRDVGVQVNSDFIIPKFMEFITSNSQLYTATGIETMDVLETIVDIAKTASDDTFHRSGGRLSLRDKIVMVYVKLKQNLSFALLAIMFNGYTVKHCQRIFLETLSLLSQCLKVAITWRTKEEIAQNTPKSFDDFEDVRVVLECTKILVQQSTELCIKDSTTSPGDGSYDTYKIITGLTPAANFSFISKPYGSKVTDDEIFQQSDILSLLEPGDAVMMDKGSQFIEDLCESNNFKCIRSPSWRNRKNFSHSDMLLTEKIAKARTHIKRSNQRIKTFRIVSEKMPTKLVPRVHEVFTVICATLNLSPPIEKNGDFILIKQLNESELL